MIGQKDVPSRLGGIEIAVEALAVRMVQRGHDVTLYNCHRRSYEKNAVAKRPDKYRGISIKEICVPDIKGLSVAMSSLIATIQAICGKYDCIHYHAEGPALMCFIPQIFGIKTVVTIHGLDWKRNKWGRFASWYLKLGEKMAVRFANEIIVLSKETKKYFWKTYKRDTVIIPNGIEKPNRRDLNVIKKKWELEKDGYFLYLGRIVPEKGIELLIRAYRGVKTEKKLVIAGGISDTKEYYENLKIAAGSDERILFIGFVQNDILDELYSNCYVYCLPSELEGMPIGLLEAMSYGNCCLCSDIPECADVIGEKGILFHTKDIDDLTKHLQILCEDPEIVWKYRKKIEIVCIKSTIGMRLQRIQLRFIKSNK